MAHDRRRAALVGIFFGRRLSHGWWETRGHGPTWALGAYLGWRGRRLNQSRCRGLVMRAGSAGSLWVWDSWTSRQKDPHYALPV